MKNIDKVIKDRIIRIEKNNLKVKDYIDESKIICECCSCNREIVDNYRNLNYSKFACVYCKLSKKSKLVKDGLVKIVSINGRNIELECENGHLYFQDRGNLLSDKKCKKCYLESKVFKKDDILSKFLEIHGNHYTYNMDNFKNLHTKIEIRCDRGHKFSQKVSNHLQGKGCPKCRQSFGERQIDKFLTENKIDFIRQKKFPSCKYIGLLPFDFYLPKSRIAIEYDGQQHFFPVEAFGGVKEYEKNKLKDQIKNNFCDSYQIILIRISYKDDILSTLIECVQKNIIF